MNRMNLNNLKYFFDNIIITTLKTFSVGQQKISNLTNRKKEEPWLKTYSGSKVYKIIFVGLLVACIKVSASY